MRWALGAQTAAGGHGTADEARVCRAVAGSSYQPGGADNSGLPTLSNRHQRHWKPDLGVPLARLAKCDGCSPGDRPGPREPCTRRLSREERPLQTWLVSARACRPGPSVGVTFRSNSAPRSDITAPHPSAP
uniref:Uncharacterized protein n=1 Tax=Rangifer tarandus platyrhynchus TaxID=3082113 RepID=A0ACB0EED5_RANTA|nr:unnamed protein product [Rangifer tarandus platyrhynchus]